jgi:large-conductance mechanosensitive channel
VETFTYAQLIETLLAFAGFIIIALAVMLPAPTGLRSTRSESNPRPIRITGISYLDKLLMVTFILFVAVVVINAIASLTVNRDKSGVTARGCGDQNTLNSIVGSSLRCGDK